MGANSEQESLSAVLFASPENAVCRSGHKNASTTWYCQECGVSVHANTFMSWLRARGLTVMLLVWLGRAMMVAIPLAVGIMGITWPASAAIGLTGLWLVTLVLFAHPPQRGIAQLVGISALVVAIVGAELYVRAVDQWPVAGVALFILSSSLVFWVVEAWNRNRLSAGYAALLGGLGLSLVSPVLAATTSAQTVAGVAQSLRAPLLVASIGYLITVAVVRGLQRRFRRAPWARPPRPEFVPPQLPVIRPGIVGLSDAFLRLGVMLAFSLTRALRELGFAVVLIWDRVRRIGWELVQRAIQVGIELKRSAQRAAREIAESLRGPLRFALGVEVAASALAISSVGASWALYWYAKRPFPEDLNDFARLLGWLVLALLASVILASAAAGRNPMAIFESFLGIITASLPGFLLMLLVICWSFGIAGASIPGNPYRLGPFTYLLTGLVGLAVLVSRRQAARAAPQA